MVQIAPSSEELYMGVYRNLIKTPYVHGSRPETEKFDFNQTV